MRKATKTALILAIMIIMVLKEILEVLLVIRKQNQTQRCFRLILMHKRMLQIMLNISLIKTLLPDIFHLFHVWGGYDQNLV